MKSLPKLALLTIVFVSGCAPQPQALSDADLAAIRAHFDRIAQHASAEDNAAWANDFTPDAVFMYQNTPALRGRAAIQQWGESGVRITGITFSDIEIYGGGDTAWVTAAYTMMPEGSATPEMGKQLSVLERQADGSWLVSAASASSDAAPPAN